MVAGVDLFALFAIAFLGSLGHCVGMCGGIVLAYAAKIDRSLPFLAQGFAHLLYGVGRIVSYMSVGALAGGVGAVVMASPAQKGTVFIVVGILMVLLALSMLGRWKFVALDYSLSRIPAFATLFGRLLHSKDPFSFFALGILNGLLPCGFVYFYAANAVASGSALGGALVMGIFGLATLPVLFGLGLTAGFLQKGSLRKIFLNISAILVLLFGIYTGYKGVRILQGAGGRMHHGEQMMQPHAPIDQAHEASSEKGEGAPMGAHQKSHSQGMH